MLQLEESVMLLDYLQLLSSTYICPFTVDKKAGKVGKLSSREYLTWAALYALTIAPFIHSLCQFVLLLLFRRENIVLTHLPVQFDAIWSTLMFLTAFPILFHYNKDLFVQVFNVLYSKNGGPLARNPLIGAYCAYVYVALVCEYGGTYQRAHRLSEGQNKVKKELREACGRYVKDVAVRAEIIRGVWAWALKCLSMRVGSFHEMERDSLLIFLDFVQRHLVSMLLAF